MTAPEHGTVDTTPKCHGNPSRRAPSTEDELVRDKADEKRAEIERLEPAT